MVFEVKGFLLCACYAAALGVVSFVFGRVLPKRWFRGDKFPWRTHAWEQKVWDALKIRRWQAKVPDMSRLFTKIMPAKKLTRQTAANLPRMIQETCVAEFTHALLSIAGLAMLWIWSGAGGIAFAVIYILLGNIPFLLIQRYNRPRLQKLLAMQQQRAKRKESASCAH